jgi:superfamily II DNA or RNA helicase
MSLADLAMIVYPFFRGENFLGRKKMREHPSHSNLPLVEYDQGTLILNHFPLATASTLPLTVWDPRISAWRAPAHAYRQIKEQLLVAKIPYRDQSQYTREATANWSPLHLREYQVAALLAWESFGRRGIVSLPTGTGKTRVAMAAMSSLRQPALCLVPTRILLDQWVQNLQEVYHGVVGVLGDGMHTIGPITVSTFESAYRNAHRLGNRFSLVVIDEVHHFGQGIKDECLEMLCAESRLGLTATPPVRPEQLHSLEKLVGPIVHTQTIEEFAGKHLADFSVSRCLTPMTPEEKFAYKIQYATFRDFFLLYQQQCPNSSWEDFVKFAAKTARGRLAIVAHRQARALVWLTASKINMLGRLLSLHRHQRLLIFTGNTQGVLTIAKHFLVTPIVSGIDKRERTDILARFRSGEIKSIVSCQVLNEGFDIPQAEIAIVVSGSQGEREHIQRIGRILRPEPGKKAIVYELVTSGTAEMQKSDKRRASIDPKRFTSIQYG